MQIKTLAEILAESDTDSANSVHGKKSSVRTTKKQSRHSNKPSKIEQFDCKKSKKAQRLMPTDDDLCSTELVENKENSNLSDKFLFSPVQAKPKKKKKCFHPASTFIIEPNDALVYKAPEEQTIKEILAEVKDDRHQSDSCNEQLNSNTNTDNLPSALKAYLRTPEQKQAELDNIKSESRLRWLAFYYLSRREHGKAELRQKLIDKEQDPDSIDALLDEFEEKGYQSDYRATLMMIRENIRKGRGRERIKQEFYKKKIAMPSNIDELIDLANTESEEFIEFVDDNEDSLVDGVDWLKLAVTARTRKYGDTIPTEQKEKAKQLRFLQYRGFNSDVCFDALNYTLDNLDERF